MRVYDWVSRITLGTMLLIAAPALAQQHGTLGKSVTGGAPIDFGFAHVAFTVPDIEASIAWYIKVLNFKILERPNPRGVQLVNGGMHIELFQAQKPGQIPAMDIAEVGIKHGAFLVKDVDALAAELRARGAEILFVRHMTDLGIHICFIRDNSGNTIEFIQPLHNDLPF